MSISLGLDLGTTTITAVALDAETGSLLGVASRANTTEITSAEDKRRGRKEWDAEAIALSAVDCLTELISSLRKPTSFLGLGITGQQHGVVLLDHLHRPRTPFINWQDKRGDEPCPGESGSWVDVVRSLLGDEARQIAGCRVSTGYMALTLYWLKEHGRLSGDHRACFLMDYLGVWLTGSSLITEPSCAASAGILDLQRLSYSTEMIDRLGLPREIFPPVVPAGTVCGGLKAEIAQQIGLPTGLPVFVGIGDNQASFLGSVVDKQNSLLVNIGTGGQVAQWCEKAMPTASIEARPFPTGGYLLVSAGLVGGAAYAALAEFIIRVGKDVCGQAEVEHVYERLNHLASQIPAGSDGLLCEPYFTGTRQEPDRRASFSNLSPANFTPGHFARALLEGVARTLAKNRIEIEKLSGRTSENLIGAGNGIRTNPLLSRLIATELGMTMRVPTHREEAAYGVALLVGEFANKKPVDGWIRYQAVT